MRDCMGNHASATIASGVGLDMHRHTMSNAQYYNLVNSPSTMINADDLYNFWRCQQGLESEGGDWVSFHRNEGQDHHKDGVTTSVTGLSELPMRHMFTAWADYMKGGAS